MRFFKVLIVLCTCLFVVGILSFVPLLSIEKLRYGHVKIDLIEKEKKEEKKEDLDTSDPVITAKNKNNKKAKRPPPVVHAGFRPGYDLNGKILLSRKVSIVRKLPETYTPLQEISFEAIHAIIVSEDMNFYIHEGVDFDQIEDALDDYRRGRPLRGASTITQQLAKNVFLTNERSMTRKLREFVIALYLDYRIPKTKIMELYLNAIEFGPNVWGIKQAAHYYFKKEPKDLSAKEGAFLAMLLPSPVRYSASFARKRLSQYARSTINQILFKMKLTGFIAGQKYFDSITRPLSFESGPSYDPTLDQETNLMDLKDANLEAK